MTNVIFYGAAVQGAKDRAERATVHQTFLETIKKTGSQVAFDHTMGKTKEETKILTDKSMGPDIPSDPTLRSYYIRRKFINAIEGNIAGAIFEVSIPSLGTGIEIAHAYLRKRMGLTEIPILLLYEEGFWPNDLTSMISCIPEDLYPVKLVRYHSLEEAQKEIRDFLTSLR